MLVRNREELLGHGNAAGRAVVLDILEAGLEAPNPYDNMRRLVRVEGRRLIVGDPEMSEPAGQPPLVFDLDRVGAIYVLGAGKAVQRMAEGLEDSLGDLITDGQINAKRGDTIRLRRIPVTLGGHPFPDEDGVAGARRILEIERRARKGDIIFYFTSGGGTALAALPAPGITLDDLREVYRVLYFGSGANMPAANAVRNHLTLLNTKHARYAGDATLIQIGSSETPARLRVHLYKPPCGATGHEAAIRVLRDYDCWDKVPQAVRDFLLRADPQYGPIQPEEVAGKPHYFFRVMGPEQMLDAAKSRAESLGLRAAILATSLSDVEAQPVAETIAYMAQEIEICGQPFAPPCVLLLGGELVVAVGNATGRGGRNTEFALAAAVRIDGSPNVVIGSVDSEGTDGPTETAGAIVDGQTLRRAREAGFDVAAELRNHNSGGVLEALGDAIYTGVRGTNVRDLRVVYVGGRSEWAEPPRPIDLTRR
jgi:glycerate 2-kinase